MLTSPAAWPPRSALRQCCHTAPCAGSLDLPPSLPQWSMATCHSNRKDLRQRSDRSAPSTHQGEAYPHSDLAFGWILRSRTRLEGAHNVWPFHAFPLSINPVLARWVLCAVADKRTSEAERAPLQQVRSLFWLTQSAGTR
jgi:hypothetical protein